MPETWIQSLDWEDPLERKWQPTLGFLPEEFMDRRTWRATVHGSQRVRHISD